MIQGAGPRRIGNVPSEGPSGAAPAAANREGRKMAKKEYLVMVRMTEPKPKETWLLVGAPHNRPSTAMAAAEAYRAAKDDSLAVVRVFVQMWP